MQRRRGPTWQWSAWLPYNDTTNLIILLTAAALLRLALAALTYGAGLIDIKNYWTVGRTILDGGSAYDLTMRHYPYPPPWSYVEAAAVWVSDAWKVAFDFVIKLPIIVADTAIVGLAYAFLRRSGKTLETAGAWGLALAMNPVSILVASGHGQFDALPVLFALAAVFLLTGPHPRRPLIVLAAWLLGSAIAFKLYPVALLPFLWVQLRHTASKNDRWAFGVLVWVPLLMCVLPFVARGEWKPLTWPVEYAVAGGVSNFGLGGALNQAGAADTLIEVVGWVSKGIYAALYVAVLGGTYRGQFALLDSVVVALVAFYVLVGTVSAQYLMWVLPFAVMITDRFTIPYSVIAGASLFLFYLSYHTPALVGPRPIPVSVSDVASQLFTLSNLILWLFTMGWLLSNLRTLYGAVAAPGTLSRNLAQDTGGGKGGHISH